MSPLLLLVALSVLVPTQEAVPTPTTTAPASASDELAALEVELSRAEEQAAAGDDDGARQTIAQVLGQLSRLEVTHETGDKVAGLFWRLAGPARRLGELRVARASLQWVLAWRERTLEADDPALLAVRAELAGVLGELDEWAAVVDLQRNVVAGLERSHDADDPHLVEARRHLARALEETGDVRGALEQFDQVYASLQRSLPADAPDLQSARQALATRRYQLGDFEGAIALFEQVVAHLRDEVRAGTRAPDDITLVLNLANLAEVLRRRGQYGTALELQEEVVATLSASLPADDIRLHQAKGHLGSTLLMIGQVERPLAIAREMLAVFEAQLPADHTLVDWARRELARALRAHGEAREALALDEEAYLQRVAELPADHQHLQSAMINMVWSCVELGLLEDVVRYAREWARSARRTLRPWGLAPRALGRLATRYHIDAGMLLTLGRDVPALDEEALLLVESLRGLETRSAREARLLQRRVAADEGGAALLADLRRASERVLVEASRPLAEGADHEPSLRERNARLTDAVAARERIQRRLLERVGDTADVDDTTLLSLARALPEHAVAVSIIAYTEADTPGKQVLTTQRRTCAMVLDRTGSLSRVELGPQSQLQELAWEFWGHVRPSVGRGGRLTPDRAPSAPDALHAEAETLRAAILDPLEALLADDVAALYISLDESILSVPLEALPTESGSSYGERRRIHRLGSLLELLEQREPAVDPADVLLTLGDVRYGDTRQPGSAGTPAGLRFGPPGGFIPLPGTAREIDGIGALFGARRPGGTVHRLSGTQADKARFFELASAARYIHLATHGYSANEDGTSARPANLDLGFDGIGLADLSPLVLTGLALSGANGSDGAADVSALLTAEELLTLDLTGCELVTLSACETSLGVTRESQGFASLQAALLGTGARRVVTSLWSVGDEPTAELMLAFYDALWTEGLAPPDALWKAKSTMRDRGAPLADWAGWIVMGR